MYLIQTGPKPSAPEPMMKSVQSQKIAQSIQLLFKHYNFKVEFMKQNVPVQQELIKKIQQTSQLSLNTLVKLYNAIKQQREGVAIFYQNLEKATLHNRQQFKTSIEKKNPNEADFGPEEWNRNMTRILEAMSNAHFSRQNGLKNYHKMVDNSFQELFKQEQRYRSEVKAFFKEFNSLFQAIDSAEKEQNKVLAKLAKQVKNKEQKQSIYFLSEVKKAEVHVNKELQSFVARNKKILQLVSMIVKNQKKISKRIKQVLTALLEKKKQVFRQSPQDQKIFGLLTVVQDGIQQSRELYLEKTLVSKALQQKFSWLVPAQKSRIHHMIKYLSIQVNDLKKKYDFFQQISVISANLSFKNFQGVSLAQGWLITSYTACVMYLTFDHYLVIYGLDGTLIKKILSKQCKINKVGDNNVVYLEEKKKGIFSDGKEEYQIKFDNSDRMEEFILFMENQLA